MKDRSACRLKRWGTSQEELRHSSAVADGPDRTFYGTATVECACGWNHYQDWGRSYDLDEITHGPAAVVVLSIVQAHMGSSGGPSALAAIALDPLEATAVLRRAVDERWNRYRWEEEAVAATLLRYPGRYA